MPEKTKTTVVIESHERTIIRRSRRTMSSGDVHIAAKPVVQQKHQSLGAYLKRVALKSAPLLDRLKARGSGPDETEKHKGEKIMTSKKTLAVLVLAGLIATVMAVVGSQFNAKGEGSIAPSLEGSWKITVMPNGADPIVDIATLTSGGGIINTDPDPNLSTGHGTWVRTGGDEFAVTFLHFLSDGGASLGTLKVRAVIQLDRATDTFSGPFRTDVIIGGEIVQSFCGTVQAKRISVEPIEQCPQAK